MLLWRDCCCRQCTQTIQGCCPVDSLRLCTWRSSVLCSIAYCIMSWSHQRYVLCCICTRTSDPRRLCKLTSVLSCIMFWTNVPPACDHVVSNPAMYRQPGHRADGRPAMTALWTLDGCCQSLYCAECTAPTSTQPLMHTCTACRGRYPSSSSTPLTPPQLAFWLCSSLLFGRSSGLSQALVTSQC